MQQPSWIYGLCLVLYNCRAAHAPQPSAVASSSASAGSGAAGPPPGLAAPSDRLEHGGLSGPSAKPARSLTDDPPRADPGERVVIAAFGDSLTDPRSDGGGYLDRLKERCPQIEIDNFGRGGTMVNQMRKRFEQELARSSKHYSHVLLFGGVNDLYSDLTALRTPEKIEADLNDVYSSAKARGLHVVAFTVAPWGGFVRYFNPSRADATHVLNEWIRGQVGHGQVDSVVDAYALLSCGDPDLLCERLRVPFADGLHFGPEGQRVLGDALYRTAFSHCR